MSQLNFKEHILSNSVFDAVVQAAKELNIEGYVVGGYVRDLILKRPSKDIDFVCVGSGIDWALNLYHMKRTSLFSKLLVPPKSKPKIGNWNL
jgi:tRNA nucleotidyltransferase/poly(A) polymerase